MSDTDKLAARRAFVALIKEENFYADYSRYSLKQHWSGAAGGFADHQVQLRWHDFEAGWKAARLASDPANNGKKAG